MISALRAPAERADALLKRPGKHSSASRSIRGVSARSSLPHSSYSTFNDRPGEKTSLSAAIVFVR